MWGKWGYRSIVSMFVLGVAWFCYGVIFAKPIKNKVQKAKQPLKLKPELTKTNGGWGLWTDEIAYVKTLLKPHFTMLEWGSGGSTKEFAPLVKEYYSIEHDKAWYDSIKNSLPKKVRFLLRPPNRPWSFDNPMSGPGGDGTYDQFKNYINVMHKIGKKFDVILIDGRARVECAKACFRYLNEGGIVLVHDFERVWYRPMLESYDLVKQVRILGVLKPKPKRVIVPKFLLRPSRSATRRLETPIVVTSVPKAGTHCAMKLVQLLTGKPAEDTRSIKFDAHVQRNKPAGNIDASDYFTRSGWGYLSWLTDAHVRAAQSRNVFLRGHLFYNKHNRDILEKHGAKVVFVYRDPRDQIVSYAHWGRFNRFVSIPERIAMLVHDPKKFEQTRLGSYLVYKQTNDQLNQLKNYTDWYKLFLPWKHQKNVYSVKYENLVGPAGGGSRDAQLREIRNIAQHLGFAVNDRRAEYIARQLYGGTDTFRKGKIGQWKEHFTAKLKKDFKNVAGKLLMHLGYAKDMKW